MNFSCFNDFHGMSPGHSFGAFHALNVANLTATMESKASSTLISRLLLVNPAGILPMTGKDGTALAVLFKWGESEYSRSVYSPHLFFPLLFPIYSGIPMYPLRSLGPFGIWLFYSFCDFINASDLFYYWFQVQAAPQNLSDHLVNPFVSLNFYSARWKSPLFEKFINLRIPVALGYGDLQFNISVILPRSLVWILIFSLSAPTGEADNISPPHQGIMLSALTGSTVPVYSIQDAWHMPMGMRKGSDFTTMVMEAYKEVWRFRYFHFSPSESMRKVELYFTVAVRLVA